MILKSETPINPINSPFRVANGRLHVIWAGSVGEWAQFTSVACFYRHDFHIPPRHYANGGRHSKKGVNCYVTWWRWRRAWKPPPPSATAPPSPLFNNTA
ncbi:hypothetical protein AAHA92_00590 [Salvia divinorum]|uniref:Uncharacterized protein n=1 Tax=Salvia divinorum TaxID=28513 RepID=A0ABD1INA0_SALDI